MLSPSKGYFPVVMLNRVTPEDQMSTLKPEKLSSPLAISGGWNAGDPWLVWQVSSSAKRSNAWWPKAHKKNLQCQAATTMSNYNGLVTAISHATTLGLKEKREWVEERPTSATPRSEILRVSQLVSSKLPGLMSLCTMPWLCRYSRPFSSWQK